MTLVCLLYLMDSIQILWDWVRFVDQFRIRRWYFSVFFDRFIVNYRCDRQQLSGFSLKAANRSRAACTAQPETKSMSNFSPCKDQFWPAAGCLTCLFVFTWPVYETLFKSSSIYHNACFRLQLILLVNKVCVINYIHHLQAAVSVSTNTLILFVDLNVVFPAAVWAEACCHLWLHEKVLVIICRSVQVTADVASLLGEQKVDAILCVAGGWAGGSCGSKGQSSTFVCCCINNQPFISCSRLKLNSA